MVTDQPETFTHLSPEGLKFLLCGVDRERFQLLWVFGVRACVQVDSGDRPRPTAPTCAQSGCETTRREISRAAYSGRVVPLLNREGLELDREWHRDLLQGDASTASIAGAFSVNIGAALDPCTPVPLVHPHVPRFHR